MWEVGLHVDGGGEEVEGGGVLAGVEVDQAEVVRDDPLKGAQVQRLLEARDGGDVALFPEEAHADVAPELRRVGHRDGRDAVLDERDVHVAVVLDDGARGEDGLGVLRVVREAAAQKVKRAIVFAHAEVEQTQGGQYLGILRAKLDRLQTCVNGRSVVISHGVDLGNLNIRRVVFLNLVRRLKRLQRPVVGLHVHEAQPLVVHRLPVLHAPHPPRLLVHLDRRLVLAQQVKAARHLPQVGRVVGVQRGGLLEQLQRLLDLALLPFDGGLQEDGVLGGAVRLELRLDDLQALVIILPSVELMQQRVHVLATFGGRRRHPSPPRSTPSLLPLLELPSHSPQHAPPPLPLCDFR
mmetsp:Transcript_25181/g.44904  ORF Transcript_25181/g.44904 Transcript_25181/m.44904 type:complete len:351 (-) Transcript_25181:115-1167(-)